MERSDAESGLPRRDRVIDWGEFLAANDRWLRTVVAARLRNRSAVEEVMQEVHLAALAQHAPLLDRERASPWLYRVAVLQSLLYRRKQGRQRRLLTGYSQRTADAPRETIGSDPLDWLLADERRTLVRQALAALPPRDAEILLLKYSEDWSYAEVAARLGISISAVEARLHRARQRLRNRLVASNLVEIHT